MKATEKITLKDVRKMIDKRVDKALTERNASSFIDRFAVRSGILEAMLEILIMSDPTDAAEKLFLIKSKYVLTRFENEYDKTGEIMQECSSKMICEEYLEYYKKLYQGAIFKISHKIIEQ